MTVKELRESLALLCDDDVVVCQVVDAPKNYVVREVLTAPSSSTKSPERTPSSGRA